MSLVAHGGTVGLIFELVPALILAVVGVGVWRRQRQLAADDEAGVEERGGSSE